MSVGVMTGAEPGCHFCPKPLQTISVQPSVRVSFNTCVVGRQNLGIKISRGPVRTKTRSFIRGSYAPAQSSRETFYELLGISEGGSLSEIKRAYKQLARKYHPDVSPPGRTEEFTRRFISVHQAYETLSDPQTRALYDRDLSAAGFNFTFSGGRNRRRWEEESDWKERWLSQLTELKRRNTNVEDSQRNHTTWGARMRKRNQRMYQRSTE